MQSRFVCRGTIIAAAPLVVACLSAFGLAGLAGAAPAPTAIDADDRGETDPALLARDLRICAALLGIEPGAWVIMDDELFRVPDPAKTDAAATAAGQASEPVQSGGDGDTRPDVLDCARRIGLPARQARPLPAPKPAAEGATVEERRDTRPTLAPKKLGPEPQAFSDPFIPDYAQRYAPAEAPKAVSDPIESEPALPATPMPSDLETGPFKTSFPQVNPAVVELLAQRRWLAPSLIHTSNANDSIWNFAFDFDAAGAGDPDLDFVLPLPLDSDTPVGGTNAVPALPVPELAVAGEPTAPLALSPVFVSAWARNSSAPRLRIQPASASAPAAVPEPGLVWLVATSLLALIYRRR